MYGALFYLCLLSVLPRYLPEEYYQVLLRYLQPEISADGEKCHKLEIIASIIKQEQRETLVQNIELAFILRSNRDIKALAALEVSMRLVQWTTIFRPSSVRFSH